jgi:cytochrome c oxidase assembly protein subunit 11
MSPKGPSEPRRGGSQQARRNRRIGVICGVVFVAMVGAAYAAVPVYRAFCQATGFGGTVRKAEAAPNTVLDRKVTVSFDANVRDLPLTFKAEQASQVVRLGETKLAFYKVTNNSDQPITARALYNVAPDQAGTYFRKLQCFCFADQTIGPRQTVELPVLYFVDPKFAEAIDTRNTTDVTLSYTFFKPTDGKPSA